MILPLHLNAIESNRRLRAFLLLFHGGVVPKASGLRRFGTEIKTKPPKVICSHPCLPESRLPESQSSNSAKPAAAATANTERALQSTCPTARVVPGCCGGGGGKRRRARKMERRAGGEQEKQESEE
eukprot:3574775-Rhodomonas_salina.1